MKKNILLVGGSYGIGQEIAKMLSAEHQVIVASRSNETPLPAVTYLKFDVTKDAISDLELPETLDGFIYCPGSINLKPFKTIKAEVFQKDLDINFMGLVKCVQELLPRFMRSEQASLIFFSTVATKVGMPYHTSVAAAKGAVEGFAKALAAEYAPNLRVNVIAPSLTDTPLASRLLSSEDKKERMAERHPLKRIGSKTDIAAMSAFLMKEEASWITGQVFGIDGGKSTLNVQ